MKKFDQINVIPFIDIMLVLLTIVLMTASFIAQGKIDVNLPGAKAPARLEAEDTLKLITIDKDGVYHLKDGTPNERKIGTAELQQTINGWQENQRVTLKIDAATPFQHFITIQDMLRDKKFRVAVLAIPEDH